MKRTKTPAPKSSGEEMLAMQIRAAKLPTPMRQYQFHLTRRWKGDFIWRFLWPVDSPRPPIIGVLVEVDGGTWSSGRHTRGKGYEADCEKLNEATLMGYKVLRFTTGMVKSGAALRMLRRIFE